MKTPFRILFIFLSSLTFFGGLFAQEPAFRLEELKIPASSPLATISYFFEDSRGFLWIGAYTGLYRYDGYNLLHFKNDPNDSLSIGDNKINKILEDPQGNFWVATQVGLNYFDLSARVFKSYNDTLRHGLGKIPIYDIKFDPEGVLWVGAADGLYHFDLKNKRFVRDFPNARSILVASIEPVEKGVYVCTPEGLYYIEKNTNAHQIISFPGAISGTSLSIKGDKLGILWVCRSNGLFWSKDPFNQSVLTEHPGFRNKKVRFVNTQGDEWQVSTDQGLFSLNTKTKQAEGPLFVQMDGKTEQVKDLMRGFSSSSGITWFASSTRKLYKADKRKEHFKHSPIDLMDPIKGPDLICELHEYSPGKLLIPRNEGASLLDVHTGSLTRFPFSPNYNQVGWNTGVICFLEDSNNRLWIGTAGGLFLFDRNRQQFVPLEQQFAALKQLRGVSIRKIFRDKNENLWLATWSKGLYKINFKNKEIKRYHHTEEYAPTYLYAGRSIFQTRSGDLWFGTRGGLLKYIESADTFLVYRNIPNVPTSMSENTSFCIYEDAEGNIWSGSYGGGLNKLEKNSGEKFKHYTTDHGLLNNNVFSLIPDGDKNLWLLGYNGISKFIPSLDSFQAFTHYQGLLNDTYDAFLYGKSRYSNHLFFGGTKGVDYFDPDSVLLSKFIPKVWLTDFKLFNESVPIAGSNAAKGKFALEQDIGLTRKIFLRYDQNVLTFDFVALDYSSPQTIQYAYQLIGFDKAWQFVGDKRSITFTNLNPGTYTFVVKASNGDGFWDPNESNATSVVLTIAPPWWLTWWFALLVVLSIAGLLTALYRYRIRQIQEREAVKTNLNQRVAQVKMEALRSQMNPHFVFNCLSSLKLFVEKNETEKASDHISKFATLLRRVLDDARTDTETVTLERELDTLRRYVELEMIRFRDKFDFRMETDTNVDPGNIEIPPLILQPYVENAILHGLQHKTNGKGLLLVNVTQDGAFCKIAIEDNGIGREAAMAIKARNPILQKSHGINVTAERLEYFSQKYQIQAAVDTIDLWAPDGTAAGTRLVMTFQTH